MPRLRPRRRSCWSAHNHRAGLAPRHRRAAAALTAQAVTVAGAAGKADPCWPQPARCPCSSLTSAVNALAAAARAVHLTLTRPSRPRWSVTGIDYLGIVAEATAANCSTDCDWPTPSAASDLSP